ncbi:Uncharacterized protein B5E39_2862 [Bacillus cereus]|nr:Uncharacterized protein B5E39_2862 [Bacillus cereus]
MINRKCSRCKEITGTMHGGKKIKKEFLCEDCLQKGIESGEIELSQVEQEKTSYLSIKILKNNECYLFNSINYNCFFCWSIYTRSRAWWNIFFNNRYSWCYDNWIHIPVYSCILRDMGIHPFSRNSH